MSDSNPRTLEPSTPSWPWLLLAVTSAVYFLGDNSADNDLWGHLFFGRANSLAPHLLKTDPFSFTVPRAPWSNHEWLGEIVFWRAFALLGPMGLLLLKLVLAGLLFAFLWMRIAGAAGSMPLAAFLAVVAAAVLSRGCAIRPQLYTYALASLTMLLVEQYETHRARVMWLMPLLIAAWVNLHGGVIVGVGMVLVYAAVQLIKSPRRASTALIVALLCVAALMVNPYGVSLAASISAPLARFLPIGEWQPIHLSDPAHRPFLFLLLVGIVSATAARGRGMTLWEGVLAIGAAAVAFRQQRHTPLFAIVATPLIARQCAAIAAMYRPPVSMSLRRVLALIAALFAMAQLLLTVMRYVNRGNAPVVFEARDYPVGAVTYLKQMGGNLALPLDWGAYALWHLSPQSKVSIDGRLETVYPISVIEQAFSVVYGWPEWTQFVATYHPDAILLPVGGDQHLRASPDWRPAYTDDVAIVYVPRERAGVPIHGAGVGSDWLPFP